MVKKPAAKKGGGGRGKKVEQEQPRQAETDEGAHRAIDKGDYDKLKRKVTAADKDLSDARSSKGGLISNACENQNLHKKMWGWMTWLRNQSPAKRQEALFHFDVYIDYEGFRDETNDLLPDRARGPVGGSGGDAGDEGDGGPDNDADGGHAGGRKRAAAPAQGAAGNVVAGTFRSVGDVLADRRH